MDAKTRDLALLAALSLFCTGFAWIQWQRRILIRWEYHAHNFRGFVQLACLVILFKRL